MLLKTIEQKPWKIAKLGLFLGALNAIGYMLSGGDEDDERKYLPEEKAGRIWGVVPKLIRMPWNKDLINRDGSKDGEAPVFLDVRRFIPVGDVLDLGQGHSAIPIPPAMQPGGPLAVLAEILFNKSQFTGKEIRKGTDTGGEVFGKIADHLTKAFLPNLPLPNPIGYGIEAATGIQNAGQTYAWTGISNAGKGRTDSFGHEQSLPMALSSAVGIKAGFYDPETLKRNEKVKLDMAVREIKADLSKAKKEVNRGGLSDAAYDEKRIEAIRKINEANKKFTDR
jgi:hypothetical protein